MQTDKSLTAKTKGEKPMFKTPRIYKAISYIGEGTQEKLIASVHLKGAVQQGEMEKALWRYFTQMSHDTNLDGADITIIVKQCRQIKA